MKELLIDELKEDNFLKVGDYCICDYSLRNGDEISDYCNVYRIVSFFNQEANISIVNSLYCEWLKRGEESYEDDYISYPIDRLIKVTR